VRPGSRVPQEEVFGPVLAVTRFRDVDEAITLANDVEYGPGNTVWTKNIDRAPRVARAVRNGTVRVNTTIDGAPQLPAAGSARALRPRDGTGRVRRVHGAEDDPDSHRKRDPYFKV